MDKLQTIWKVNCKIYMTTRRETLKRRINNKKSWGFKDERRKHIKDKEITTKDKLHCNNIEGNEEISSKRNHESCINIPD